MARYSVFYTRKGSGVREKVVTAQNATAAKRKVLKSVSGITSISARKK